ncbi:MAG TPA: signal peptidase I [Gaiellaceae bacterium]|nr:signal peptidase I [Gaiellaceae bacterium]
MKRRRQKGAIAAAAGLVAVVALWLAVGPMQLGGPASYATIVGSSMEPVLERGDLAIVRTQESYGPGDAVLYDDPELGAKVLHRIVRVEAGRYVLKGDNNDFLDETRPGEAEIVGKLWTSIPRAGLVAEWVHQPRHAALVVGLTTLLALGSGAGFGLARRRSGSPGTVPPLRPGEAAAAADVQPALAALGAVIVLSALLALIALTRPAVRTEVVEEAYAHQGTIDYSAHVARNAVYPDGEVTTGQPVFLRLVDRLRLEFRYQLQSQASVSIRGRVALDARLADGRGWSRTLPLAEEQPFRGPEATVTGTLNIRLLQSLVDDLQALTGSAQAAYSLTILPRVSVTGRNGVDPIDASFAPAVAFDFGDLRLQPNLEAGAGVGPFAPRQAESASRTVPNELSLGAVDLPVGAARRLALLGVAGSLLLAALVAWPRLRRDERDDVSGIVARFGPLLLPVASRPPDWARVTELADMDALVRLAEHHGRMILHLVDGSRHSFVVEEGGNAYRYTVGGPTWPAPRLVAHDLEDTVVPRR